VRLFATLQVQPAEFQYAAFVYPPASMNALYLAFETSWRSM
jgi:hypothetical protein